MAGWLDELFNAASFGGQSPEGLLARLSQMAQAQAGPSQGFAPPAMSGGGGAMMPLPMMPQPAPQMSDAGGGAMMPLPRQSAPDLPTRDVGPLPQPPANLPADAQASAEAALDTRSGAGAMALPAGSPPFFPGQELLGRIGSGILRGLHDNSNSLIAGGGAMISGGLGRGLSAMAQASPLDIAARHEAQSNEAIAATQKDLMARGFPAAQARALALDPAYRKEVLLPRQHVSYSDAYGNQHLAVFDPGSGQYFGPDGKPLQQGPGGPGGAVQSQLPEGPDWFEKLPVEYQTEAKNYALGLNAGTANPRKGMPQMIKDIASKWATEHGLIIDENTIQQRKTMMTNLAKSQPGTEGGQLLAGRTAVHHLASASEDLVRLNNWSSGIAPVTGYINQARGLTDAQKGILESLRTKSSKYGEEITKYYIGTGGTHGEREHNASLGIYEAPSVQADILEAEKKLIPGRLVEQGNHIRDTLGEAAYQKWFVNANKGLDADMAKIDRAIATLRGEGKASSGSAAAPSAVPTATGPNGQKLFLRDGKWVPE